MNVTQFLESLTVRNLRLAEPNEAGWYEVYISEDGERISVWVTDMEKYNITFSETDTATMYGLTINDVEIELFYSSGNKVKYEVLIVPKSDEYPIEAFEFDSEREMMDFYDELNKELHNAPN